MSHRAKRGVCIGVDQHLAAGDSVPSGVGPATLHFLLSIGAIEPIPEEPPQPQPVADSSEESSEEDSEQEPVTESTSTPRKRGRRN